MDLFFAWNFNEIKECDRIGCWRSSVNITHSWRSRQFLDIFDWTGPRPPNGFERPRQNRPMWSGYRFRLMSSWSISSVTVMTFELA
jgi:hypothetical protein